MIKYFIRTVMMNIAYIIDIVAVLLILNQWLNLDLYKLKVIAYILITLGVFAICVISFLYNKYDPTRFFNGVTLFGKISLFIFLCGSILAIIKISCLGIERGSTLYFSYSYPALLPLISNLICFAIGDNT